MFTALTRHFTHRLSLFLLVLLCFPVFAAMSSTGCAPKTYQDGTKVSIEGQTGIYGQQLVSAISALAGENAQAGPLDALVAPRGPLSPQDALKVGQGLKTSLTYARQLQVALVAVDNAKDAGAREAGLRSASAILMSLSDSLSKVTVGAEQEAGRLAVVQLLSNASALVLTIQAFLPPPVVVPALSGT